MNALKTTVKKPNADPRRTGLFVCTALLVALTVVAGSLPLAAQEGDEEVLSVGDDLIFQSEVDVVTVPVTVTDRKGRLRQRARGVRLSDL